MELYCQAIDDENVKATFKSLGMLRTMGNVIFIDAVLDGR